MGWLSPVSTALNGVLLEKDGVYSDRKASFRQNFARPVNALLATVIGEIDLNNCVLIVTI